MPTMSTARGPQDGDDGGAPPPQDDEQPPSRRRPPSRLAKIVAIIGVIELLVTIVAGLWTESLWFEALGYSGMWWSRMGTQGFLFVAGGLLTALPVGISLWLAHRTRPLTVPATTGEQALAQYRQAIEPFRKATAWLLPTVLGILGGLAAAGQWQTWLLWRNGRSTGSADPEFGRDVS